MRITSISALLLFTVALVACHPTGGVDVSYSAGNSPKVELTRSGSVWKILVNGEDKTAAAGFVGTEQVPQTLYSFTAKDVAGIPLPAAFQLQTRGDGLGAFCGECGDSYKNWSHSGDK